MGRNMRKNRRSEAGFTLTELLIVIAILGVLVAVVLPNFVGLLGGAQSTSADAELKIVQTAVDAKMAAESLSTITAVAVATNDMTSAAGGFDLAPTYMRSTTTKGTYTMDATGAVTQVTTGY
jgi:prepilin-type N-terminal cleavage/methylation domain-containing protein